MSRMTTMTDARIHLLQAVLRRCSRSAFAPELVLRGGLMMQLWVGAHRRSTRDIDFLALYPRDLGESVARFETILAMSVDDAVSFDRGTLRGEVIWQETPFPGHRILVNACVAGQQEEVQIDTGFDDPLVPPAEWIDYPALAGPANRIQAVRPELLAAWKLHGLFEHGVKRWQGKDLFDLWLLTSHCVLDEATLAEAIRVAFTFRGDALEDVPKVVYAPAFWQTETARKRWAKFRDQASVPVPDDASELAARVGAALWPALSRLISLTP